MKLANQGKLNAAHDQTLPRWIAYCKDCELRQISDDGDEMLRWISAHKMYAPTHRPKVRPYCLGVPIRAHIGDAK
jgi:hypothetical protein